MDLASAATSLSQSKLATQVSYAVQKQVLGAAKAEGAAVLQLLSQAAQVGQAGGTDPLAAAATGKGGLLDVYG